MAEVAAGAYDFDWAALSAKLPIGKDEKSARQRKEMCVANPHPHLVSTVHTRRTAIPNDL